MARYRDLIAWQKAHLLAKEIYQTTEKFPKSELFGLTSQLRRAALSVPCNIVEGYCHKGNKELLRFLNISLGSLAEVEYLIEFSKETGFLGMQESLRLSGLITEIGRILWKLMQSRSS